ncbi:hypothetical protein F5879DRAFT_144772 [Lentinula edodes]|nr:hypothetical protein F5879DRAFT_144772 [Lentinula edodes]
MLTSIVLFFVMLPSGRPEQIRLGRSERHSNCELHLHYIRILRDEFMHFVSKAASYLSQNLATCLQCGYDNVAGMTLFSAQQYLTSFTTACAANGTSVETETLGMNSAETHLVVNLEIYVALWAVVFWISLV